MWYHHLFCRILLMDMDRTDFSEFGQRADDADDDERMMCHVSWRSDPPIVFLHLCRVITARALRCVALFPERGKERERDLSLLTFHRECSSRRCAAFWYIFYMEWTGYTSKISLSSTFPLPHVHAQILLSPHLLFPHPYSLHDPIGPAL